ncbi:MAG: MEDS domain-containing protein [Thermoplasmata archaeon]
MGWGMFTQMSAFVMLNECRLSLGQTVCAIHENECKKTKFMFEIFKFGLEQKCKSIHFHWGDIQTFKDKLYEYGLDLEKSEIKSKIEIHEADKYYRMVNMDFEKMILNLLESIRSVLKEGYNGCIVCGDIGWPIRTQESIQKYIDYYLKFKNTCPNLPILRITNFEVDKVSTALLIKLLNSHDMVICSDLSLPTQSLGVPEKDSKTSKQKNIAKAIMKNTKPLSSCYNEMKLK